MMRGEAVYPDSILEDVCKYLGEVAVELLNAMFNKTLMMSEEKWKGVLVPTGGKKRRC